MSSRHQGFVFINGIVVNESDDMFGQCFVFTQGDTFNQNFVLRTQGVTNQCHVFHQDVAFNEVAVFREGYVIYQDDPLNDGGFFNLVSSSSPDKGNTHPTLSLNANETPSIGHSNAYGPSNTERPDVNEPLRIEDSNVNEPSCIEDSDVNEPSGTEDPDAPELPSVRRLTKRRTCPTCSVSITIRNIQFHIRRVHLHEGARYQCLECDTDFSRSNDLKRHVNSVHRNLRYKCKHCPKAFARKDRTASHEEKMH